MPVPEVKEGAVFGKLTVIEHDHTKDYKKYWLCRCECGSETVVYEGSLKRGLTTSCGSKGCRQGENLIGQTFGNLTVIRKDEERSVNDEGASYYICLCTCGNEKSIRANSLLGGKTRTWYRVSLRFH